MMRLTPLSLAANTIFYLILAVMYCRVLTRRFSWPFTLLGLTVGYLLYIIPTKFMPYADAERMLFGLVTFPLTPIVLFRDKWYKSLLCAFAGLVAMAGSDLLSVSWLLTPEQLREYSHYPEKHFGQPHFLACYTDGPALLAVNKLRTVVRQTELAAYAAFRDPDGNVTRSDMILGLNRLSSLMWIMMIKWKAGQYRRQS